MEKLTFILPDPRKVVGSNFREMIEMIGERGILEVHPGIGMGAPFMSSVMGMENAMVSFYENRQLFDALLAIISVIITSRSRARCSKLAPR